MRHYYTRWLRASRINEGLAIWSCHLNFTTVSFSFIKAQRTVRVSGFASLGLQVLGPREITLYHVGFPEELIEIS
ncbi:hypothetical protein VTL71DRAFT_15514 [Oculimacula yallundae]|uniref:Uncharacterized protein n=1 Tax=Oculimacula yallundae TaxID=86028 RepID=A0ABR4CGU1_9HELO